MFLFVKIDSATSQVVFLVDIADLWLRNLILNSFDVEPTYWTLRLLQVTG